MIISRYAVSPDGKLHLLLLYGINSSCVCVCMCERVCDARTHTGKRGREQGGGRGGGGPQSHEGDAASSGRYPKSCGYIMN